MSTIKVNTITKRSGSTLTIGECGATVQLATGATQTGFGRTGTVDWCTTAKTSPFTAVSGKGYFVNTTSGSVTITLPASPSAGDIIAVKDYANTFDTNDVVLENNGSKINGVCGDASLSTESQSVTLIYVDATKGWQEIHDSTSNTTGAPDFIVASGGTITTCGDFKIHTFTSSGTFTVCTAPQPANRKVSYMVVAGGGGGACSEGGGGGGAGGFREGKLSTDPYTASPLAGTPCSSLPISVQAYPITIGAGGGSPPGGNGCNGSNSVFSTITSAGGGFGSYGGGSGPTGNPGGSGGGGGGRNARGGGTGNTPPVSPPQGNNGGVSAPGSTPSAIDSGGGGGGASAVGGTAADNGPGGAGGAGVTTSITGSPVARAGGGGGGSETGTDGTGGTGGGGSGGTGGTANTGGGGGGAGPPGPGNSSAGGSGIVVIRYKFQ